MKECDFWNECIFHLNKTIELEPRDVRAYMGQAMAYYNKQK